MTFETPEWFREQTPPPHVPDDLAGHWEVSVPVSTPPAGMGSDAVRQRIPGVVFDGDAPVTQTPELVQGMLPCTGVGFLGGQSGAGKTFIVIDLAIALTTKTDFFGRKVRSRVGVVIVAAEGAGTIPDRIEVARRHRGAPEGLPIATVGLSGDLTDPKSREVLLAQLLKIDATFQAHLDCRLGIVIVDTLAAAFSIKDENANAEASAVMRILAQIGAASNAFILAVHHYGKSSETGLRGASAYRASADAVISVLGNRDEIAGTCKDRVLAIAKSRTGSEGPLSGFDLIEVELGENQYGEPYGSCAVKPTGNAGKPQGRPRAASQRLFSEAFECALLEHGEPHQLNSGGPVVRAVTIDRVRVEYLRRKVTGEVDLRTQKETANRAFRRHLERLPAEYSTETSLTGEWLWRAND